MYGAWSGEVNFAPVCRFHLQCFEFTYTDITNIKESLLIVALKIHSIPEKNPYSILPKTCPYSIKYRPMLYAYTRDKSRQYDSIIVPRSATCND